MTKVLINGRFLTQRTTSMRRYALETLRALDDLLATQHTSADLRVALVIPRGAEPPRLKNIPVEYAGYTNGHTWEQLALPYYARNGLLLNLCPTGPLFCRAQAVTLRDATVFTSPNSFKWSVRTWLRWLLPALVRRAAYLVAVSHSAKWELVAHCGADAERVYVSGEGWEHVTRVPADHSILSQLGIDRSDYVLVRLGPHVVRNLDVVLRSAELLKTHGIAMVVAGRVDKRTAEQLARRAPPNLLSVPRVDDRARRALYENATAFVYPSGHEGAESPLLEALAYRCPIVASRSPANQETCGEAVLFYHPQDPEGLVRRVLRLKTDPELRPSLIQAGQEVLRERTWKAAALRHLAALTEYCLPPRPKRTQRPTKRAKRLPRRTVLAASEIARDRSVHS